jgi:hypothetical protein
MNNIKIAKLISSEFIIGRLVENILTNILLIKFNVNSLSGELSKSLIPYMSPLTTSIGHIISLDKVITMETASEELIGIYVNFLKSVLSAQEKRTEDAKSDGISNIDKE